MVKADVRIGQRWARAGSLSYEVVGISEEGASVQLSGPGPVRGLLEVDYAELLEEWRRVEPTIESVCEALDKCARLTMRDFEWLKRPSSEATEFFRALLSNAEGSLPTWMPPEFWTVEYHSTDLPSSSTVKAQTRGLALVPTCLVGKRIEFHPSLEDNAVKASVPSDNLFVVGDNYLEALIGLARLVSSKSEGSNGTAT